MEGTCETLNCALFNLLGGKPEQCPNFIETVWVSDKGEKKLVRDCAPKRTLLMVQDLYNRQVGLQKAQEEMRNSFQYTGEALTRFVKEMKLAGSRNITVALPEG